MAKNPLGASRRVPAVALALSIFLNSCGDTHSSPFSQSGNSGVNASSVRNTAGFQKPTAQTPGAIFAGETLAASAHGDNGNANTSSGLHFRKSTAGETSRLTTAQLSNSVVDILGVDPAIYARSLKSDLSVAGYPIARTFDATETEDLLAASQSIADAAVTTRWKALSPCAPDAVGATADTCHLEFLKNIGRRFYRRPLTEGELQRLTNFARASNPSLQRMVHRSLVNLLNAPQFLFIQEGTVTSSIVDGQLKLNPFEIATRLARAFTNSVPDEELLASAALGRLADPDERKLQVQRLLETPRGKAALASFFSIYLGYDTLLNRTRDVTTSPLYRPQVMVALKEELNLLTGDIFWSEKSSLSELFSTNKGYVNDDLAPLYGLTPSGDALFRRVEHPSAVRAGILGRAGIIAANSRDSGSINPIFLGKFIRENVLCGEVPAPPAGIPSKLDLPDVAKLPVRERFKMHSSEPVCAGCHRLMDDIAVVYEEFDDMGVFRGKNHESLAPGFLANAGEITGAIAGPGDLSSKLASSTTVRECFVRQATRFLLRRLEHQGDAHLLAGAIHQIKTGNNMRSVFLELAASEVMSIRHVP